MNPRAARISPDASMKHAAEVLALTSFADLVVVDAQGRYVGVLSEGDLLRALMPDLDAISRGDETLRACFEDFLVAGAEYAEQPISRLVIRQSITLRKKDELLKAATVMVDRQIRRLAVVDGECFLGSVSRADICWALLWPEHVRTAA
jgi:CBS domain-containing protein